MHKLFLLSSADQNFRILQIKLYEPLKVILEALLFVLKTGNLFNMASLVFQPVVGNLVSPEFMLPLVITLLGWIRLFPS